MNSMVYNYDQYSQDVLTGKIVTNQYIKLACERYEQMKKDPDIIFDEQKVHHVIKFIYNFRHFSGKVNGKHFILEPWQQWILANLFGFKWKDTGLRVFRKALIIVCRKAGKSALIAAIALYMLIADGEAQAEVDVLANSREQASILFSMCQNFMLSVDPKCKLVKQFRNKLKFPLTKSVINLLSSDAGIQDGYNPSCFILDEVQGMKDSALYDVMISGQGFREQPLGICISSAGFLLDGFLYKLRGTCIDILRGYKEDPAQFVAIYELDETDDWTDEDNWIKGNPNLGVTVTKEFLKDQVTSALNQPSLQVSVKTKNCGLWSQTSEVWIDDRMIVKHMHPVDLKDFDDCVGFAGVDLSSVSDLTALSVMIQRDYRYYFKTFYFLPSETVYNSPNSEKYKEWVRTGQLIAIPNSNVTDYDEVLKYLLDFTNKYGILIESTSYDSWNSTQFTISATNAGINMVPYSQALGSFNKPCKEFERALKQGNIIIDANDVTRWCFQNSVLKVDSNENCKPTKPAANQKIDGVIAMLQCLGGYLNCPQYSYEI